MMGTRYHPGVAGYPYFVTAATKGRRPILGDPRAADLLVQELVRLRDELGFALLAYAVMPDHLHLLVVPSAAVDLSRIMQSIKGGFARLWNRQSGSAGSLWQARFYESAVRTEAQLWRWIEYINQNPVKAGLAATPEEYPYCSAGGRLAVDLEAYGGGPWRSRAEARPSG